MDSPYYDDVKKLANGPDGETYILPLRSDPSSVDGDDDGLADPIDPFPLAPQNYAAFDGRSMYLGARSENNGLDTRIKAREIKFLSHNGHNGLAVTSATASVNTSSAFLFAWDENTNNYSIQNAGNLQYLSATNGGLRSAGSADTKWLIIPHPTVSSLFWIKSDARQDSGYIRFNEDTASLTTRDDATLLSFIETQVVTAISNFYCL